MDNDGDGKIDYPFDPGCTSPDDDTENTDTCSTTPRAATCPQCGNGIDDDGDGRIDYPADPGCTSAADNDESDDCIPAAGMPAVTVTDITATGTATGMVSGTSRFQAATPACGSISGAEAVFEYRLTQAVSSMAATTCSPSFGFDSVVYIRRMSCLNGMPANEVACNDDYSAVSPTPAACSGDNGLLSFARTGPLQPGIYFIFVDTYAAGEMGPFTLHVTTTP
jgi:hypothetical protein